MKTSTKNSAEKNLVQLPTTNFKIGDRVKYKNLQKFTYTVTGFEGEYLITKSGKCNNIMMKKSNAVKI